RSRDARTPDRLGPMPRASSPSRSSPARPALHRRPRQRPRTRGVETRRGASTGEDERHAEDHDADREQMQAADAERVTREDHEDAEDDGDHGEDPSDHEVRSSLRPQPRYSPDRAGRTPRTL